MKRFFGRSGRGEQERGMGGMETVGGGGSETGSVKQKTGKIFFTSTSASLTQISGIKRTVTIMLV